MKNKKSTKKWWWIGGIAGIVIIILSVVTKRGPETNEVTTAKVEMRTITETVSASGKIQPEIEVKISPDVSGQIVELYVKEGDSVKQGQLLLEIDPDIYISEVERSEASLSNAMANQKSAEAQLAQAKARFIEQENAFKRTQELRKQGSKIISDADYDAAKSAYDVAFQQVEAAKKQAEAAQYTVKGSSASVKQTKKNLKRTSIFAPADGIISKLNKEKGESVVGTGQMAGTEIMTIADLTTMEVQVEVSENDIVRVKLGDTALIEVDAYLDRKFKGIVTEIANSSISDGITTSTNQVTNFEVKIRILPSSYQDLTKDLPNNQSPFRPGMSATVDIQTKTVKDVIAVPIEAVTTRPKEDSTGNKSKEEIEEVVFVMKDGKAVKTLVKIGIQDDTYMQIISGLDEGTEVANGPYKIISVSLKDGDLVTIKKEEKKKDFEKDE